MKEVSSKYYDLLKWTTLVLLPAFATFYLALAQTWNLPYPTEVAGSIAAIDVFLATLLGISIGYFRSRVKNVLGWDSTQTVAAEKGSWFLPKEAYNVLTWAAQVLIPAMAALYLALSAYWPLPAVDQVVATLMALDTFMGFLLGFSSTQYMKSLALSCLEPEDN